MHHHKDRIAYSNTSHGALAEMRNSSMGPFMEDHFNDPSHCEWTLPIQ